MKVVDEIMLKKDSLNKELIQNLWADYGELFKCEIGGCSYVVKQIKYPSKIDHPRGWNTIIGDKRKRKSYQVEKSFYQNYSNKVGTLCRIPSFIECKENEEGMFLVLEDLNQAGFDKVKMTFSKEELKIAITWLARFHAINMNKDFPELWEEGSYWYLDTRKEEFERMEDGEHKQKAHKWSEDLKKCKYQTLLHGDAKYANFLWNDIGDIAAVDFQYVGKGCGMKDLMYLFSCDSLHKNSHDELKEFYFTELVKNYQGSDFKEIKKEWEPMFEVARKDFERFLIGWSPGHWKLD